MKSEHKIWFKSYELIMNISNMKLGLIQFSQNDVYFLKHLKPHQVNEVQMIVNMSFENEVRTQYMVEIL